MWLLPALLSSLILTGASAADEDIEALRREIQQLDQKLKVLERRQELEKTAATERTKSLPNVSLGAGGLQARSADSNFTFAVRGYIQADARFYPDDYSVRS
jgi:phosphate-selective porin OprO and OprP